MFRLIQRSPKSMMFLMGGIIPKKTILDDPCWYSNFEINLLNWIMWQKTVKQLIIITYYTLIPREPCDFCFAELLGPKCYGLNPTLCRTITVLFIQRKSRSSPQPCWTIYFARCIHILRYGKKGNTKRATCPATLLQNELNSDVARFTTHTQTGLAANQVVNGFETGW